MWRGRFSAGLAESWLARLLVALVSLALGFSFAEIPTGVRFSIAASDTAGQADHAVPSPLPLTAQYGRRAGWPTGRGGCLRPRRPCAELGFGGPDELSVFVGPLSAFYPFLSALSRALFGGIWCGR
jgi:hypothetical protein